MNVRRAKGFTLVEVLIATGIVAVVSAMALVQMVGSARQKTFEEAIDTARAALAYADSEKKRVTATAIDASTGKTLYTYAEIATWTTVANLNTARGSSAPARTPYDTDIEVLAPNDRLAQVRFQVPAGWPVDSAVRGATITDIGSGVRQVVLASVRPPLRMKTAALLNYKRGVMTETFQ